MTIRADDSDDVVEIKRSGIAITVRERDRPLIACTGGAPTVLNTDTMKIALVSVDFADVDLGGGPFAPGATPEAEGAPEIEIEITAELGTVDVFGTAGKDEWHWGDGGANPGLNLNPRESADRDVDVTIAGDEDAFAALAAYGEGGDDTIVGAPGATVRGTVVSHGGAGDDVLGAPRIGFDVIDLGSAELLGDSGDDVITGGRTADKLSGGAGRDRVDGRGGADVIIGGSGRDSLAGGAGPDTIRASDFARDIVRCGSGRDRVVADRRDLLSGCERR